jgi:hypothetical protein
LIFPFDCEKKIMASPNEELGPLSPPSPIVREAGWNESSDPAPVPPSDSSSSSAMDEDVDVLQHEKAELTVAIEALKERLSKLGKYF